ncbi:carboxymuconolactone decarboxylase family protein [Actinomadura chibensis]|uniref:Carboxymuconolactone decarboxylase family protein n=1 Tax=Actinomadura chibensis TaxID=392828 RepID=A0A5D0NIG0_9ACTN|nr:carboxymuconolactone decarboxylase family protein [Actinomadura chibensis]TYB44162.1 carboxymuconolactone decarboxylase family protein [Actinomadura chibensis]
MTDIDPEFEAASARLADVASRHPSFDPKVRELVALAVNAAVTHLHEPGIRRHVRGALENGATRAEILETFQLVSVLGIHAASVGFPLLRDLPLPPADADVDAIRAEFVRRRGYWDSGWDEVLRRAPGFFAAYLDFSSVPWRRGALEPKVKELIYVAIDASATHLFTDGLRVHIGNAARHGATPDEIAAVLEIASAIGVQTWDVGVPILLEELDRRDDSP